MIPQEYVAAVRRAGGVPVLFPPGEEEVERWLSAVDAVIVAGGTDLSPTLYGADGDDPRIFPVDQPRDATELLLTKALLVGDTPCLFICRGLQVLNVASGGTLHAHLPDAGLFDGVDIHRNEVGLWTNHGVEVVAGSRLAQAMGATVAEPVSGHHQGVDRVGSGLDIVAVASDGVVEGLEVRDHRWAVAVQWHPELTADKDQSQQGIFDGLIGVAGEV
jgi:putative glutamine amidotransferase